MRILASARKRFYRWGSNCSSCGLESGNTLPALVVVWFHPHRRSAMLADFSSREEIRRLACAGFWESDVGGVLVDGRRQRSARMIFISFLQSGGANSPVQPGIGVSRQDWTLASLLKKWVMTKNGRCSARRSLATLEQLEPFFNGNAQRPLLKRARISSRSWNGVRRWRWTGALRYDW